MLWLYAKASICLCFMLFLLVMSLGFVPWAWLVLSIFLQALEIDSLLSTEWRMRAPNWYRLHPCWKLIHTLFLLGITWSMALGASCLGPLTCSSPLMRLRYSFIHSFISFYMENLLTEINLLEVRTSVLLRQQNTDKVMLLDISFTAPDSFHTFDGGLVTFYSRSCAQRLIWKGFTDLLIDCLDVQRIAVTGFSAVRIVSIPAFLLGTVGRDVDKYAARVQKHFLYLKSDGNIICHAHLSFPLRDRVKWKKLQVSTLDADIRHPSPVCSSQQESSVSTAIMFSGRAQGSPCIV